MKRKCIRARWQSRRYLERDCTHQARCSIGTSLVEALTLGLLYITSSPRAKDAPDWGHFKTVASFDLICFEQAAGLASSQRGLHPFEGRGILDSMLRS
ncbi:hypothetical protein IE53DRAFT_388056 [Violaceomyces palustris]|uniref:Uncharacterized protein n=1 Tax=Violaceomyces palustris TaxID=1673888 RepID=A0ACD0NV23_9BASI|nr:hypothetical protein IE53DRAFT_388056 [Violaceomyces palustris]